MSTVIILWAESGRAPKPVGTSANVQEAMDWCQQQANSFAPLGKGPIPLSWKRYLSRGSGPATGHRKATFTDGTFEIWTVGQLS